MSRNAVQEYYTSSPQLFVHFFLFDRIDPRAVYTSRIRGAFVHHATANISSGAQYFRAHRGVRPVLSFSPFLRLSWYVSPRGGGMRPSQPHVVMPSEACDISCHASRTLRRRALAHRNLPLAHIYLVEMSRNKSKNRGKCFVESQENDIPLVRVTLAYRRLLPPLSPPSAPAKRVPRREFKTARRTIIYF